MKLTALVFLVSLLLATPALSQTPQEILAEQLKSELSGSSQHACQLMSQDYQQMFFQAAAIIGQESDNCRQAVDAVAAFRIKRDDDIKAKSRRQVKGAKRAKVAYKNNYARLIFSYRGSPPGWSERGRFKSKESYLLVKEGESWLVDRLLYTRTFNLN